MHAYSIPYQVAALGNVTTDIEHRRKGIAIMVVAAICKEILAKIDAVGLKAGKDVFLGH